jgi:hypothetical protein
VVAATDVVARSRFTSAVRETVPARSGGTWIFDSRKSKAERAGTSFRLDTALASSSGGVTRNAPQLPLPRYVKARKQDTDSADTHQNRSWQESTRTARVTQSG